MENKPLPLTGWQHAVRISRFALASPILIGAFNKDENTFSCAVDDKCATRTD